MDEPCTNRIVPLGAAAGDFCHRKSLMSPFLVQCSLPFIAFAVLPDAIYRKFCARIRRLTEEGLHGHGRRDAGHVPEAADAPRTRARRAAGNSRGRSRPLAELGLADAKILLADSRTRAAHACEIGRAHL